MRDRVIVVLLACVGACTKPAGEDEAQVEARSGPESEQADPAPVALSEPAQTDPAPDPAPEPAPIAEVANPLAARRWLDGAIEAPSRSSPPPTSVLGQLPKAEAIAVVVGDGKLELVAAVPSGWRLQLVEGQVRHVNFEPASGLLFFYRERSVWAVDLLEPLADDGAGQAPVVELARLPANAPDRTPDKVLLCFPPPEPRPYVPCWPDMPLPDDADSVPEYLEIAWSDTPKGTWYVPARGEQYRRVPLQMVGREWLRARADRRQHFAAVVRSVHGLWQATSMADAPSFQKRCLDAEVCGKSLPFGTSGWEWAVVGSSRGDLFHPFFAVYDPATKRWANWEQLTAGTPEWVPTAKLEQALEGLGDEAYPLFDGGGRVFASPSHERLCWFRYAEAAKTASAVACEDAGGQVVGFLSVSTRLGEY